MTTITITVNKEDLETLFSFIDSINDAISDTEQQMDEEEQAAYDNILDAVYVPEES